MMYRAVVRALVALMFLPVAVPAQSVTQEAGGAQVFESLPNGGIIELQRAPDDSIGMRIIRMRLRAIGQAFAQGDLSSPAYSRMTSAPGARVMVERRNAIRYDYRDLPRGGALRITTADGAARQAIWEFIAYQRSEGLADP